MEAGTAPPAAVETTETVSLSIELPRAEFEMLQKLAEERGITEAQALRQAIRDEKWFRDRIGEGKTVMLRDKDGELRTVTLP